MPVGTGDRVPSRQNPTRGSRRGLRDSQNKFYDNSAQQQASQNPNISIPNPQVNIPGGNLHISGDNLGHRLGSPFPNFQKKNKVILPSLQQNNGTGNNGNSPNRSNGNVNMERLLSPRSQNQFTPFSESNVGGGLNERYEKYNLNYLLALLLL